MTLAEIFAPVRRAEWWFWGIILLAMVLFHIYVGFINTAFCWMQRT